MIATPFREASLLHRQGLRRSDEHLANQVLQLIRNLVVGIGEGALINSARDRRLTLCDRVRTPELNQYEIK